MKILLTLVAGLALASVGCGDSAAPKTGTPKVEPEKAASGMAPSKEKIDEIRAKAGDEGKDEKEGDKAADKDADKDADKEDGAAADKEGEENK